MAQPAAATPATPLTFHSEAEREAALEKLQNREDELTDADLAEIDRIESAEIVAEGQQSQQPAAPAPQPAPAAAPQPAPVQPAAQQPQQPAAQPAVPAEQPRIWQIDEKMISQFDEEFEEPLRGGGFRRRKTITQKTPEDLLKSFVGAERRIRYLQEKAMPEAYNDGFRKARSELTTQIDKLTKERDDALAQLEALKKTPPTASAPQQAEPTQPAADVEAHRKNLADTLKALSGVEADDMMDHVAELASGFKSAVAIIENQGTQLQKFASTIDELRAGKTPQPQPAAQPVAPAQQPTGLSHEQIEQRWREACRMVDAFVAAPDCPADLKIDQGFDEATADALGFHEELARHYTQKPVHEITDADRKAAVAAYLSETPQLLARVQAAGLREPANYRKWVVLDQIDALRSGQYRDPRTKEWRQRYSPDTGRPVQFPDMRSAYNEYLRVTGQDKAQVAQAVRDNQRQMVDAINRRDSSLTQMDLSQAVQPQVAAEVQIQQAHDFLATHDYEEARRLARRGDRTLWDEFNKAWTVLGMETAPLSDIA